MADSRQRAPFAHTSSSADLTSPDILSPLRSFPGQPREDDSVETGRSRGLTVGIWGKPPRMVGSDQVNGVGVYDKAVDGSPELDTPRRSPSPRPFGLPSSFPLSTIRFVCLCALWYISSAISSNTGKVILNNFRYPITLTIVQFFFVSGYCIVCSKVGLSSRLKDPTKSILRGTLPMAVFQVGGHIFGSLAISRVPVSTVHTIKALSPLFTVLAYALLFQVSYSPAIYLSLLPLTLGVMLACSFDLTISNVLGLICAFGSTLVFVSQTIFFKRIMPTESSTPHKLDKINLLYFSSGMAFILMIPVWIYSDAWRLLHHSVPSTGPSVIIYFIVNGTVHFAQNLLAFAILSSTSPVTYSIASLVKRIAVICLAIVWFKQSVHSVQAVGIGLTAVGLWMYNNAKRDVEKGEKKMRQIEAVRDGILPLNKIDQQILESAFSKDVHKSPRPIYPHNYLHSSKSSAIRSGPAPPYPSPPASASSSPTSDPIPPKHTRHGRASSGTRECHPQPITSLTTTIDDISRPTIMAS